MNVDDYAGGPMVQVTIDGIEADPSAVTCNHGLNYGRFDDARLSIHKYAATFPRVDFVRLLSDTYDKCVAELREDDAITGEDSELASAGWPSLNELVDLPKLAADTVKTYIDRDTFAAFGFNGTIAEFIINSTDSVEIDDDSIVFRGRCFRSVSA